MTKVNEVRAFIREGKAGLEVANFDNERDSVEFCKSHRSRELSAAEYDIFEGRCQDIGSAAVTFSGGSIDDVEFRWNESFENDLLCRIQKAMDRIDFLAENMRGRYITPGAGQALAYQAKTEEAKAFQGVVDPVDADYPHLYEEALATSSTVAEVAALVLSTKQSWTQVSAKIEGVRRGAKKAINSAKSVAEIDQVLSNIVWPDLPKDSSDD